jgi:DNA-binding transcriptional LysR family regulator
MSIGLKKRIEEQRLDLALINCATRPVPTGGEIIYNERVVWAGAKCGSAYRRDPLPISIWEEGCIWRSDALTQLQNNKRNYRVAFLSAHTMAQRAAVVSDLAIAPFPRSYVTEDMTILGPNEGLPELNTFDIRLLTASQMTGPMAAVADSIRYAFGELARAA